MRYRVGFADKGVQSTFTKRNPGYSPIIDTHGPFAFGSVICICDTKEIAERICNLLNATEPS